MKKLLFLILIAASCSDSKENTPMDDVGVDTSADVGADAESGPPSLISSEAWSRVPFEEDPFDPPQDATCDAENGLRAAELASEPTFEIETTFCGWGTVHQTTSLAIEMGDAVNYRVWHFDLVGDTDAVITVRIDDWDVLNVTVPQPADATLHADTVTAPRAFPVGTDVFFHVHNHGANEYSMIELSVGTP